MLLNIYFNLNFHTYGLTACFFSTVMFVSYMNLTVSEKALSIHVSNTLREEKKNRSGQYLSAV